MIVRSQRMCCSRQSGALKGSEWCTIETESTHCSTPRPFELANLFLLNCLLNLPRNCPLRVSELDYTIWGEAHSQIFIANASVRYGNRLHFLRASVRGEASLTKHRHSRSARSAEAVNGQGAEEDQSERPLLPHQFDPRPVVFPLNCSHSVESYSRSG